MSGIVEVDPKVKSPKQELEIDNLHRKGSMSKNGNKKQSYDHTFDSIAQDSVFDQEGKMGQKATQRNKQQR